MQYFFLEDRCLSAVTNFNKCAAIISSNNNLFIWKGYVEGSLRFAVRINQPPLLRHFLQIEPTGLFISVSEGLVNNNHVISPYGNAIAKCRWTKSIIEKFINTTLSRPPSDESRSLHCDGAWCVRQPHSLSAGEIHSLTEAYSQVDSGTKNKANLFPEHRTEMPQVYYQQR